LFTNFFHIFIFTVFFLYDFFLLTFTFIQIVVLFHFEFPLFFSFVHDLLFYLVTKWLLLLSFINVLVIIIIYILLITITITITIHIHIHIPIRISFFTPTFINSLFKSSDFLLLMLHNLSPLFFDRLILLLQPSFSLLLNLHLLLHPLTLLTDLLLHILPFFQIFLQNLDLPWIPILLQHLILLHFLQLFF